MSTSVFVTTRFVGFHRWKDAPEQHAYLRNWHRHVFHVRLTVSVNHDNREVEFIDLKKQVDEYIACIFVLPGPFEHSCEQIARLLLDYFSASEVEVSEDGENGAILRRDA